MRTLLTELRNLKIKIKPFPDSPALFKSIDLLLAERRRLSAAAANDNDDDSTPPSGGNSSPGAASADAYVFLHIKLHRHRRSANNNARRSTTLHLGPVGGFDNNKQDKQQSGAQLLKPDYWLRVPRQCSRSVYSFFMQWRPEMRDGSEDLQSVQDQGFILFDLEDDQAIASAATSSSDPIAIPNRSETAMASLSREWEVVAIEEAMRRRSVIDETSVLALEMLPELCGESELLQVEATRREFLEQLTAVLPARAQGYAWRLTYATSRDGFSLNTMYRRMREEVEEERLKRSPVVVLVVLARPLDLLGQEAQEDAPLFGAVLSDAPTQASDRFLGTGESLLWTFHPYFHVSACVLFIVWIIHSGC